MVIVTVRIMLSLAVATSLMATSQNAPAVSVSRTSWTIASRAPVFVHPLGVAVGARGNVFVSDWGDRTIKKVSPTGVLLAVWHGGGRGLEGPGNLAVDERGGLFVVDGGRIATISPRGRILGYWTDGQAANPVSVATGAGNSVYVLGTAYTRTGRAGRVTHLTRQGRLLASWSVRVAGFPLVFPVAVAVDPRDDVYVSMVVTRANACIGYGGCRAGGFTIEKFSSSGKRLGLIRLGASLLGLGLAVDRGGNMYWTQVRNRGLIEKLGPGGVIAAKWGTRGCGPGRFTRPHGLALDRQGNLYVADEGNRNVQKLSPTGRPLTVWGNCR